MGEDATHENERRLFRIQQEELLRTGRVLQGRHLQPQADEALELAIGRFASWVRSQALTGSTTGEMNANTVYADIVKRIMRPTRRGRPAANEPELDKLLRALSQLEQENRAYAQFGLTSPLSMDALVSAAQDATANTRRILAGVLQPYVDGLRARLTALASVQRLLTVFVDSANSFLSNKSISFNLRQGLRIQTVTGAPLKARMLSSGERQLLLLLCNTAVAREQASIFIIDEPEISLNVKWQRKLLDALLKLTADSDVQFVIATHSVELLARHMASVSKLAHEAVESS